MEKTAPLKTRRAAPMRVRSEVRWKESRAVDRTGQNQQGMVTHRQKELGQRLTILIFLKKSIFRWEGFYRLYVTPQTYKELVKKAVSIFILLLKTRDSHTKFS